MNARILTSNHRGAAMPLSAPGFALLRQKFDELMWRACGESGVYRLENTRVASIKAGQDGYRLSVGACKSIEATLEARFVVDAPGRNARLHNETRAPRNRGVSSGSKRTCAAPMFPLAKCKCFRFEEVIVVWSASAAA